MDHCRSPDRIAFDLITSSWRVECNSKTNARPGAKPERATRTQTHRCPHRHQSSQACYAHKIIRCPRDREEILQFKYSTKARECQKRMVRSGSPVAMLYNPSVPSPKGEFIEYRPLRNRKSPHALASSQLPQRFPVLTELARINVKFLNARPRGLYHRL